MTQKKGSTQQSLINNFYGECKSLLSVNHNRVLRLLGAVLDTSEEGCFCFCHLTNYQQKGDLLKIIREKQFFHDDPVGSKSRFYKKIKLLAQTAEGINAIHAVGIVHRDIKAQNVLLDENDAPKISDLGMAANEEDQAEGGGGTLQ